MALNINDILCPEIFVKHIFRCLCYDDLINAILTCKKWKAWVQMLYEVDERIKCKSVFCLNLSVTKFYVNFTLFQTKLQSETQFLLVVEQMDILLQQKWKYLENITVNCHYYQRPISHIPWW